MTYFEEVLWRRCFGAGDGDLGGEIRLFNKGRSEFGEADRNVGELVDISNVDGPPSLAIHVDGIEVGELRDDLDAAISEFCMGNHDL